MNRCFGLLMLAMVATCALGQDVRLVDVVVPPPPPTAIDGDDLPGVPEPNFLPSDTIRVVADRPMLAEFLGQSVGLVFVRSLEFTPNAALFRANSPAEAVEAARQLRNRAGVREAQVLALGRNEPQYWPNDTFFAPSYPPADFPGQWHAYNKSYPGLDINVIGVWDPFSSWLAENTGAGIITSVVEEGVVVSHGDLSANYDAANSYDFVDGDNYPEPSKYQDGRYSEEHGTSCAGLLAGVGGNGKGISGIAPAAKLAPIRFSFLGTIQDAADAIKKNSYGSNTNIKIKSHSYGYEIPYYNTTDETQAIAYSATAGTIHTWSAGNYRGGRGQDSGNKQTLAARRAIVVAALGSDGKFASYSNFGSNVFCTAPSSSGAGLFAIATTDTPGESGYNKASVGTADYANRDYTRTFGGTSAACPITAGVMTLGKKANSVLDARMAQHLLVKTCRKVDPTDNSSSSYGGWRANAAGIEFNPNYGFGLIDASAFVDAAKQYTGVTPEEYQASGVISINQTIPDNNTGGIQRTINVTDTTPLESIQAFIAYEPERFNDLEIFVRSPQGMWSRLSSSFSTQAYTYADNMVVYQFVTNAFWGQSPAGNWTFLIRDVIAGKTAYLYNFQIIFYQGTLTGTTKEIKGSVNLGTYYGDEYGVPAEMQFWESGDIFPTKTHRVTIQPDGTYSFPSTIASGVYNVYLKTAHWLRKERTGITVTSSGATINWTLTNGDVDGDNVVGLFDYLDLSAAFDTGRTDWQWNPNADLLGDGTVDLFDYLTLSQNFDREGD